MTPWLNEPTQLGLVAIFLISLAGLVYWESRLTPPKASRKGQLKRWETHLGLLGVSLLCIKAIFPFSVVWVADMVHTQKLGVLHENALPLWLSLPLGVLSLDFTLYLQHRMVHKFSWLWRVHRTHHLDKEVSVITGLRFHPLEQVILTAAKIAGVLFWGIPPQAVLVFEGLWVLMLLFTHLPLRLPPQRERFLRYFLITPALHRVHHSDIRDDREHNFGFCFNWWDKLLRTYKPRSFVGDNKLVFGIEGYQEQASLSLRLLLLAPFKRDKGAGRKKLKGTRMMG